MQAFLSPIEILLVAAFITGHVKDGGNPDIDYAMSYTLIAVLAI